nr:MAG TPA: hypothetical protein [Bacteriophage sp.]
MKIWMCLYQIHLKISKIYRNYNSLYNLLCKTEHHC